MNWIIANKKAIKMYFIKIFSIIFGALTFFALFINYNYYIEKISRMVFKNDVAGQVVVAIVLIVLIIIIVLLITLLFVFFKKINNVIPDKIICKYGDIIKMAFYSNIVNNIFVIPVNTYFDVIVDKDISSSNSIVSVNSLHGKFINELEKNGYNLEEFNDEINDYLLENGVNYEFENKERKRGNKKSYPIGTIVVKKLNNNFFYLLAFSKFDDKNNANCTMQEYVDAILKLIHYYNINGNGYSINIPLLGTGLSRTCLTHHDSLLLLSTLLINNLNSLIGTINIIIYNKDANKTSIYF